MGKHDIAHKEFYSHPENVKDLIQGFVALDCVSDFDFSTLERENTSFVVKEGNERHDDIIWRLKWRGKWVYIYIIIEFQSNIDEAMPARIMSYTALLYLNLLNNENLGYGKGKKLPIVLPIVLYNGQETWNVPTSIQEMVEATTEKCLEQYIPKLSYYFIDEVHPDANKKDTVFNGLANSVAATMKLQRVVNKEDFKEFVEHLKELFKDERQKQRFGSFMAFLLRFLGSKLNQREYKKARNLNEVIKMTYTFIDYELEHGRKKAIEEGMEKGILAGKKEGKLNAFYDLIKNGLITLEQAASTIGITKEQLILDFKKYNLVF